MYIKGLWRASLQACYLLDVCISRGEPGLWLPLSWLTAHAVHPQKQQAPAMKKAIGPAAARYGQQRCECA